MRWRTRLMPLLIFGVFTGATAADPAAFADEGVSAFESPLSHQQEVPGDAAAAVAGLVRERYSLGAEFGQATESPWYGFVGADVTRDSARARGFRGTLSSGPAYRFYDDEDLRLSLHGAVSYGEMEQLEGRAQQSAGLEWGFNWEQTFFDQHLNFFHRHRGNRGLTSNEYLTINAETGVEVPLAPGFSATARYDLEWDRSRREETGSASHIYTLGLGYAW